MHVGAPAISGKYHSKKKHISANFMLNPDFEHLQVSGKVADKNHSKVG